MKLLEKIVMNTNQVHKELKFKTTRSSGPGGQHVNKVSSKVIVTLDLSSSTAFLTEEKELLFKNLNSRISNDKVLSLSCEESRSQHKNKEIVIKKMMELLKSALIIPKKRKRTKPSKASIQKRLDSKKKTAQKKSLRKKLDD